MKYFIDCKFLEGTQTKRFLSFNVGQTKPTIDLISIGIVAEDGREYYAISKDFNLKEAWNRYDLKPNDKLKNISPELRQQAIYNSYRNQKLGYEKKYCIRENVLKSILKELESYECGNKSPIGNKADYKYNKYSNYLQTFLGFVGIAWHNEYSGECTKEFGCCNNQLGKYWLRIKPRPYNRLKRLLNKYGKTNQQIAEEIKEFINSEVIKQTGTSNTVSQLTQESIDNLRRGYLTPEFYGYYADYDWVAFCWLFGKMIDLPKGFPMYCIDLKQMLDEKILNNNNLEVNDGLGNKVKIPNSENKIEIVKKLSDYPKQTNEHNALADARWNKQLFEFLNNI